jgi:hypothetical protein
MLFALGAASTALNAVQSLTSSASSTGFDQGSANPFEVASPAPASASPVPATGFGAGAQISPATMSELLAAQSQSTATPASTSAASGLQDLFSQIDGNGDGQITKSEFENALGAGGTNLAQADDVFSKLDSNGDGTVSLAELASALKRAGGHHGAHQAASSAGSGDSANTDPGSDPLLQAGTTAPASATSSYQSLGQLLQREAQAISFSAAPLSFNA